MSIVIIFKKKVFSNGNSSTLFSGKANPVHDGTFKKKRLWDESGCCISGGLNIIPFGKEQSVSFDKDKQLVCLIVYRRECPLIRLQFSI